MTQNERTRLRALRADMRQAIDNDHLATTLRNKDDRIMELRGALRIAEQEIKTLVSDGR